MIKIELAVAILSILNILILVGFMRIRTVPAALKEIEIASKATDTTISDIMSSAHGDKSKGVCCERPKPGVNWTIYHHNRKTLFLLKLLKSKSK